MDQSSNPARISPAATRLLARFPAVASLEILVESQVLGGHGPWRFSLKNFPSGLVPICMDAKCRQGGLDLESFINNWLRSGVDEVDDDAGCVGHQTLMRKRRRCATFFTITGKVTKK